MGPRVRFSTTQLDSRTRQIPAVDPQQGHERSPGSGGASSQPHSQVLHHQWSDVIGFLQGRSQGVGRVPTAQMLVWLRVAHGAPSSATTTHL